jgi:hypothetical protein
MFFSRRNWHESKAVVRRIQASYRLNPELRVTMQKGMPAKSEQPAKGEVRPDKTNIATPLQQHRRAMRVYMRDEWPAMSLHFRF